MAVTEEGAITEDAVHIEDVVVATEDVVDIEDAAEAVSEDPEAADEALITITANNGTSRLNHVHPPKIRPMADCVGTATKLAILRRIVPN